MTTTDRSSAGGPAQAIQKQAQAIQKPAQAPQKQAPLSKDALKEAAGRKKAGESSSQEGRRAQGAGGVSGGGGAETKISAGAKTGRGGDPAGAGAKIGGGGPGAKTSRVKADSAGSAAAGAKPGETEKSSPKKTSKKTPKKTKAKGRSKKGKGGRPDDYKWYILKTKANCELKAKESLLKIIKARGLEDQIREIRIPERETVQVVKGKKATRFQRIFPGYIFVEMKLGGTVWHSIQSAPNISHFIGGGKPFELPKEQLARIHQESLEEAARGPKIQMSFSEGESVKVIDGPFKNFNGTVAEVNQEKGRVKVLVSIFGRPTPIDFDFAQVYKEF